MNREQVKDKFEGKCAYSGTLLQEDWQVDHVVPKSLFGRRKLEKSKRDHIDNLVPCQRIINHYKGDLSLEEFRNWYLGGLHLRLSKLPKNPKVASSIRHKEYLLEVASLFDITPEKPFSGKFYFETI